MPFEPDVLDAMLLRVPVEGEPVPAEPLTGEELSALETQLTDTAMSVNTEEATAADIELLSLTAEHLSRVRGEMAARAAAAQERREAAARLMADISPAVEEPEVEAVVEPEVVAEVVEPQPEAVAAAAARRLPSLSLLAARQPARTGPRPDTGQSADQPPRANTLTAAADMPGLTMGHEADLEQWAYSCMRRFESIRKAERGNDGEHVYFGTVRVPYPEERMLTTDEHLNAGKISAVVGDQALVASGGICGPVAVDYSITTIAAADRPVKTALAQFGASRGGLRYVLPHTLSAVTTDGPASLWTETTDVTPGGSTKPHATFVCQSVQENYVDAVTAIVQFGNFQARYFPEQIQQYMETVDAVHSRVAESNLLSALSSGSTAVNADSSELGAARDVLATLDRATAAYRYRNRMLPSAPLRFVSPYWLRDMIRADLTKEVPGDSGSTTERLATADAEIDNFFATRNINTSWAMEAKTSAATTGASAITWPPIQGAGQLSAWPLKTVVQLYHEGAWVFLDGGELNLGMVRDSTLNKTNDFQMFSETFEKAIFRGHETLELTLTIAPTGASAGTVTTTPGTVGS